jgi:hypothetical protein
MSTDRYNATSRYYLTETAVFTDDDGREISYLKRRFIAPPHHFAEIAEHEVKQGDRIDNLAAHHLGDPLQFWRLCDANGVMRPEELTETIGRRIRITLPEGIPGASDA